MTNNSRLAFLLLVVHAFLAWPLSAYAISQEAEEFMRIAKALEPVHCQKRKLRREIALAEAENRAGEAAALRKKFAALDRDPRTARLEARLGELEPWIAAHAGPDDLAAISRQQREAFYRCE